MNEINPTRNTRGTSFMARIFWNCAAALLIGTAILMFVNNILIHGISIAELWDFTFKVVLAADGIILLLLMAIVRYRLRPVNLFLRSEPDHRAAIIALERLYRLPSEMFWGMIVVTFFFSVLFHFLQQIILSKFDLWETVNNFVAELSLGLTLALLLFSFVRSSLRPIIVHIQEHTAFSPKFTGKSTMMNTFMFTFVSCQLIMHFNILRYVISKLEQDSLPDWGILFSISAIYFLFGMMILLHQSIDFRRELRTMIRSIHSIFSREDQGVALPVLFKDELGQFAASVNEFGERLNAEYDRLEKEFQLASHIQKNWLPDFNFQFNDWQISAHFKPSREVSGDLYDVVQISDEQIAVMNGDVSGKGLPAAVLMSAVIVLFRAEIYGGGTAGQILTRLNRLVADTVRGDMFVTLGLALVDTRQGKIQYASAGHMAPYLLSEGSAEQLMFSSFPLGIDPETVYQEKTFSLEKGERLVLYTDGVVEATDPEGNMFGFERFENLLASLPPHADPGCQLNELLSKLHNANTQQKNDDWTIVLLGRQRPI